MAPIIPTQRPIVTPERAAIVVAIAAVACSVFLVFSTVARAEPVISSPQSACDQRMAGLPAAPGLEVQR